jgi:hypothetical protein
MTDLDRYLDDFGGRLEDAARGRRRPQRRRRLVLAFAAAVAGAAVLATVLTASQRVLDPVAEAREALLAPGEIVYMKVTSSLLDAEGPANTVELWSATDPPRWRMVQELDPAAGIVSDEHGRVRGRMELSYGNGEQSVYYAERDTLEVNQGFSDHGPHARVPNPLTFGSGDVEADLRTMLRDGEVTDMGEQQAGGRTVRRLVSESEGGTAKVARRLVYDVDPDSFEPIQATLTFRLGDNADAFTTRMTVDAYERIPIDEASARLLEIQTTPRTKVTVNTPEEMRERDRRCRHRDEGMAVCPAPDPPGPPDPKAP